MRFLSFFLMALCLLMPSLTQAEESSETPRTIVVSGEGKIRSVPDGMQFTLTIENHHPDVQKGLAANDRAVSQILDSLRDRFEIAAKDITTDHMSIDPRYVNCNDRRDLQRMKITPEECVPGMIETYHLRKNITIHDRQTDRFRALLVAALEISQKQDVNVRMRNLQFMHSDREAMQDRAEIEAVEDARATARRVADTLGVKLGEPLYVSLGAPRPVKPQRRHMARAESAMSAQVTSMDAISPGEDEISAHVHIEFAIGAGDSE